MLVITIMKMMVLMVNIIMLWLWLNVKRSHIPHTCFSFSPGFLHLDQIVSGFDFIFNLLLENRDNTLAKLLFLWSRDIGNYHSCGVPLKHWAIVWFDLWLWSQSHLLMVNLEKEISNPLTHTFSKSDSPMTHSQTQY